VNQLPVVSVEISKRDSTFIERLITEGKYPTKSDILRTALRDLFEKENVQEGK